MKPPLSEKQIDNRIAKGIKAYKELWTVATTELGEGSKRHARAKREYLALIKHMPPGDPTKFLKLVEIYWWVVWRALDLTTDRSIQMNSWGRASFLRTRPFQVNVGGRYWPANRQPKYDDEFRGKGINGALFKECLVTLKNNGFRDTAHGIVIPNGGDTSSFNTFDWSYFHGSEYKNAVTTTNSLFADAIKISGDKAELSSCVALGRVAFQGSTPSGDWKENVFTSGVSFRDPKRPVEINDRNYWGLNINLIASSETRQVTLYGLGHDNAIDTGDDADYLPHIAIRGFADHIISIKNCRLHNLDIRTAAASNAQGRIVTENVVIESFCLGPPDNNKAILCKHLSLTKTVVNETFMVHLTGLQRCNLADTVFGFCRNNLRNAHVFSSGHDLDLLDGTIDYGCTFRIEMEKLHNLRLERVVSNSVIDFNDIESVYIAQFIGCTFAQELEAAGVYFGVLSITPRPDGSPTVFHKTVELDDPADETATGTIEFTKVQFLDHVQMRNRNYRGHMHIRDCTFYEVPRFESSKLNFNTNFVGTEFRWQERMNALPEIERNDWLIQTEGAFKTLAHHMTEIKSNDDHSRFELERIAAQKPCLDAL